MSTYISATDVTVTLPAPATVGTNTVPLTLAEVATWCDEVGAEIDGAAAAAGYAVPISPSSTGAYAQVRRLAKTGVAAQILGVLAPNVPAAGGKMSLASEYRQAYETALERLREGKLPLVGATSESGDGARELPRSFESSNVGATLGGASPMLSVHGYF